MWFKLCHFRLTNGQNFVIIFCETVPFYPFIFPTIKWWWHVYYASMYLYYTRLEHGKVDVASTWKSAFTCRHINVYTYTCTCVYILIHVYIHTYTHALTRLAYLHTWYDNLPRQIHALQIHALRYYSSWRYWAEVASIFHGQIYTLYYAITPSKHVITIDLNPMHYGIIIMQVWQFF